MKMIINIFIKPSLFILLFFLEGIAGELKIQKDFDPTETFHVALHNSKEAYLVCIYSAKIEPRNDGQEDWSQIVYKGTIVNFYNDNNKKIGDQISFIRVADRKLNNIFEATGKKDVIGDLKYVFYTED